LSSTSAASAALDPAVAGFYSEAHAVPGRTSEAAAALSSLETASRSIRAESGALAGTSSDQLLSTELSQVGRAFNVSLAGGDYQAALTTSSVENLKATAAANFVGPIPEIG